MTSQSEYTCILSHLYIEELLARFRLAWTLTVKHKILKLDPSIEISPQVTVF
jgi:hypothetical protein